jgi:hypothetical protein
VFGFGLFDGLWLSRKLKKALAFKQVRGEAAIHTRSKIILEIL